MPHTLDYGRPDSRRGGWLLNIAANLSVLYPLLILSALYGQWLLSWYLLGHPPRISIDDPKYIQGANWMHPITGILLFGAAPAGCAALILNAFYVSDFRIGGWHYTARMGIFILLWAGALALIYCDPFSVGVWWMD